MVSVAANNSLLLYGFMVTNNQSNTYTPSKALLLKELVTGTFIQNPSLLAGEKMSSLMKTLRFSVAVTYLCN